MVFLSKRAGQQMQAVILWLNGYDVRASLMMTGVWPRLLVSPFRSAMKMMCSHLHLKWWISNMFHTSRGSPMSLWAVWEIWGRSQDFSNCLGGKSELNCPEIPVVWGRFLLTGCLGQVGEEGLKAAGKPLHALMKVGQSFQVTDITKDLILGDQLVSKVASQDLGLFGKSRPEWCGVRKKNIAITSQATSIWPQEDRHPKVSRTDKVWWQEARLCKTLHSVYSIKLSEGPLQLLVFWMDLKCLVCRDKDRFTEMLEPRPVFKSSNMTLNRCSST